MNPTLWPGDGLKIISCDGQRIRPGDVIVFVPPGKEGKIVHRVVSVDSRGIRTRGDNNKNPDPWALTPDDILGRVVSVHRGSRRQRVFGGSIGEFCIFALRFSHLFGGIISFLLRPVYHRLGRSLLLSKKLHRVLRPTVVSFRRPEGIELQAVMGHSIIARRIPGRDQWHIRRPFRLFVDEESLSGEESISRIRQ